MATRRRGPATKKGEKKIESEGPTRVIGDVGVFPTPDTNSGLLLVRRAFNYLVLIGAVAGLLYIFYKYLLFENATSGLELEDPHQPFSVVDIPGKGKGVVANRDISQGELILREAPLFLVPNKVHTSPGALLLSKLATLSVRQREQFYNLSYVHMPPGLEEGMPAYHDALVLAIFQTNSISAGENSGIFPRTARLNHGCSRAFNAVYTWRDKEGTLVVHALKSVSKGEEILTTYTDTKRPRSERRHYLKALYDFECGCSVCSLPEGESKKSDDRLAKMVELKSKFATWGKGEVSGKEAASIAREIWGIGEEEGYWSERGQLAADTAWVAASHSDVEGTRWWAKAAVEWFGYELGRDSDQVAEMAFIVEDPHRHRVWGTRSKESVL